MCQSFNCHEIANDCGGIFTRQSLVATQWKSNKINSMVCQSQYSLVDLLLIKRAKTIFVKMLQVAIS